MAVGTYRLTAQTESFQIPDDVKLVGGFQNGDTNKDTRSPADFELTILSGDINGDSGGTSPIVTDDAYHVVSIDSTNDWTMDGFKIQYGNAVGTGPGEDRGGGIFFVNNLVGTTGCTLTNLTVQDCLASGNGAGIHVSAVGSSNWSKVVLRDNNCINPSTLTGEGGGLYIVSSGPDFGLFNFTFDDNRAIHGGGLYILESNGLVTFQNGVWTDNTAWAGGGVFRGGVTNGSATQFSHCTLAYNEATAPASQTPAGGSAFYNTDAGTSLTISSSILYRNIYTQKTSGGVSIVVSDNLAGNTINAFVEYSDVQFLPGGGAPPQWFGTGSISVNPKFTNGSARILTLKATSPCIDAADDNALIDDLADLDGDGDTGESTPFDANLVPREVDVATVSDTGLDGGNTIGSITDMGAYEVQ